MTSPRRTKAVPDQLFRRVYDSPASLPGEERWVTSQQDVEAVEKLLGMARGTIGAPLWVSGDFRTCPSCQRELSWLDIVSSALERIHEPAMIARVILGEQKFVNSEVPRQIEGVRCHGCGAAVEGLRSFKCHNWAYAHGALLRVLEGLKPSAGDVQSA
ncbi:MAG: hypothetical protein H0X16_11920 [Chloroflexi bacterium]|nr:hypothetical protein [Chloroflexota bacterium]